MTAQHYLDLANRYRYAGIPSLERKALTAAWRKIREGKL